MLSDLYSFFQAEERTVSQHQCRGEKEVYGCVISKQKYIIKQVQQVNLYPKDRNFGGIVSLQWKCGKTRCSFKCQTWMLIQNCWKMWKCQTVRNIFMNLYYDSVLPWKRKQKINKNRLGISRQKFKKNTNVKKWLWPARFTHGDPF